MGVTRQGSWSDIAPLHKYRYLMRPRMFAFAIISPLNSTVGETWVSVLHTEMKAECLGTVC